MQITPMDKSHIDGVYAIEKDCFAVPWSRKAFEGELENKLAVYVVATEGNDVIGYGGMWHVVTEGHITNIAVHKDHRRRGVGDAIVKALIGIAEERNMIGLTLEVRKSNDGARKLYENNGFKLEGIRTEYYEDNREDALIMWKYLINEEALI